VRIGSGTTLIAAESCGREARLIEYDPGYCDTIIARWQNFTGKRAVLAPGGKSFEETASLRSRKPEETPSRKVRRKAA